MPTTQKHTPEQIAYLLECTPAEARVYAAAPALVEALDALKNLVSSVESGDKAISIIYADGYRDSSDISSLKELIARAALALAGKA